MKAMKDIVKAMEIAKGKVEEMKTVEVMKGIIVKMYVMKLAMKAMKAVKMARRRSRGLRQLGLS